MISGKVVGLKWVSQLLVFALFASALGASSYCQTQKTALQLVLSSEKQVYAPGEKIGFTLIAKNLSSHEIPIFDTPPSGIRLVFVLLLDGKEYTQTGPMAWGGPNAILPHSEMKIAIDLVAYGISNDRLTLGKHSAAVKYNETVSNTISFDVMEAGKIPVK